MRPTPLTLAPTLLLGLAAAGGCVGTVEGELPGPDAARTSGADAGLSPPDAGAPPGQDASLAGPDAAGPRPDAATAPDAAFRGTLTPGDRSLGVEAAGRTREVLVYAPAAVSLRRLPLVIALHGNGDTNANFVAALGLRALADADGFVLAAPQGLRQSFTAYGTPIDGVDWDAYRTVADGNIDLPLLEALLAHLLGTGSIDPQRASVFGYSQGGYLSFRWTLEGSLELACGTTAAAGSPLGTSFVQTAARKIPVALQVGALDGALGNARASRDALRAAGHAVLYNEIPGAGHVPFPGDPAVPLRWCLGHSLP